MPIQYNYGKNKELLSVEITADQWKVIENFIGKGAHHIKSSSLTTNADDESIRHIKPISLAIEKCKSGWIPMTFSSRTAWVMIYASDCFDPFQDIIDWLCKIARNELPAAITINEEGIEKTLHAEKATETYIKLSITDFNYDEGITPEPYEDDLEYPRTYIKTFVNPDMLINEMLTAFKSFFSDPQNYSPWKTLGNKEFNLNFEELEDIILKRKGITH